MGRSSNTNKPRLLELPDEGNGLLGAIVQRQDMPRELTHFGRESRIMAETDHQGMKVLDIAVVQGRFARLMYERNARGDNDERGKELVRFLKTVVQICGQCGSVDFGGALNIGQRVGRHVERRPVADEPALGPAPDLDRSGQDFLLYGQPGYKGHPPGWIQPMPFEDLTGMSLEKRQPADLAHGLCERGLAHPVGSAKSDARYHESSSKKSPRSHQKSPRSYAKAG